MPHTDKVYTPEELNSLNTVQLPTPITPSPSMTAESSKYDKGFIVPEDPNKQQDALSEYRAQSQSSIAKLGSGLANTVTQASLDVIKDASYLLDVDNYTNFKESSEQGFHNWLGDAIQGLEDKLKLPVYRTKESAGFSPLSAGWWGDNLPSLASSISMIIPAEGAIQGLGALGKLMGGEKIIKSLESASGVVGLADKARGVGAAIISRHMESLMEGGQTFEDTFKEAKKAGKSDDEAKQIAGEAAATNYKANWAAIVQDIPEYMILHKTFKESSSLFSANAAKEALKTVALEGSEEAYQYITDKEAKRSALINGKVLKDDNTSLSDRLLDYAKDGDLWTSAFFGAIGGATFGAYGIHQDSRNQEAFDPILEAHKAILKGDPDTYSRAQDNLLNLNISDAIANGKIEDFKSGLKYILSNPERIKNEDRAEINKRLDEAIRQSEYAESISKDILNDPTLTPELKKLAFNTRLNQRSAENRLSEINTKVNSYRGKDFSLGLEPDVQAYKEAKLTLDGIKSVPKLANKAKALEANITSTADEITKAYPSKYATVEALNKAISSSHDLDLTKLLTNKVVEEANLSDTKDLSFAMSTDIGKKILNDKIQEKKQKIAKSNEIDNLVTNASTEKELDKAFKEADKHDLSSPELIDRIAKKRQEIKVKDQILTNEINGTNVPEVKAFESTPDIINEETVDVPNPVEDEGKKPTTINKTNNGTDDGSKEAEDRAYRFHEALKTGKVKLDGHRLKVVTRSNNSELFAKILEQDPTGKKFEEDFYNGKLDKQYYLNSKPTTGKHYNGIYTVLVDKNNNIILADQEGNESKTGKMVFQTLETEGRVQSNDIVVTNKDKAVNDIVEFRGSLLKQTNPEIYLPVAGTSKGIAQLLPPVDGIRQSIPVMQSFGPIKSIKLELPTQQADSSRKGTAFLSNGQVAFTGKLYAFDSSNTAFDLIPRKVSTEEADMIMNLLSQKFSTEKRTVSFPITQIEKIISTLVPEAGANNYTFGFKDNTLYVGKNMLVTAEDFDKPEVKVAIRQFLLSTKYVNANINKKNGYDLEDKFIAPTVDDKVPGKVYNSYKEYLLSGESPMFGTDLVPKTGVQYRQVYLKYEPTIQTNILGKAESISDSNGEVETIAEVEFGDSEAVAELNEEPKAKRREFYKSTEEENESLDRTVKNTETKPGKLTNYEKDWFTKAYPNIPITLIEGLIEGKSFGRFLSSGKVLLSNRANSGTLYHEAFHVTTQLYLTPKELEGLYTEARERLSSHSSSDKQIEEKLAEDYAVYKETGNILKGAPKRNNIFRRLTNLLKDLVGLSASSVEDIYRRLDKGYYANKKIVGVRQFSELDSTIKGLSVSETKDLMSGMDAMFFDIAFKDNKTPAEALAKTDKVLEYIYKRLVKKEQEIIESGDEKLIATYDSIFNNWPDVMNEWNDRMKSLGVDISKNEALSDIVPVDDEENKVEETGERSGSAYQESNEVSTKSTMFNSTKMLIRSLKQKNTDGSDVLNSLGLPQTVEFGSTYNFLLKQLIGLSEYQDLYDKIKDLSSIKPEFKDLLDRLKERSVNLNMNQMLFQNQFRQNFAKNMATSFVSVLQEDGTILQVDASKQNIQDKTKEKWKSKLKTVAKINGEGRYIVSPVTTKDNVSYLNSIGIYFSDETLPHLKDNKEFTDAVTSIRNYVRTNNNDVTDMYGSEKVKDTGIAGNINTLLALESEYNTSTIELSVTSADNKTIYPIGQNNGFSITKNLINNSKNLEDLYSKLPNLKTVGVEGSVWLSAMFDEEGNRRADYQLQLNLANGLTTDASIRENNFAETTRKLGTTDKFIQEMDHLLKYGNSSMIRTADKGTEYLVGLNKYNGKKLIIPIKDLAVDKDSSETTGLNNEALKSIFRGYFKSELKGIAMYELYGVGRNIDEYSNTGGNWTVFHSFPFMKGIKKTVETTLAELKAKVNAETISTEEVDAKINEVAKDLESQVDIATVEFFTAYATELRRKLVEYKVLNDPNAIDGSIMDITSNKKSKTKDKIARKIEGFSKELLKDHSVDELINAVVVNDFINKVEQTKILFGNMAFYKALFKRTSSLAGTKETNATDEVLNAWLNKDNKRLDGKVADGKVNVAIFEDSTQSKQNLGEYKKALMKLGFSESEADSLLNAYKKMDEGDAQGWITLDEYREFMIRLGSWSPSMDTLWDKAQKGESLTKEEIKYFIVKKAQYAGPISDEKLFIPGFHKFSLMPLLPQLVKGRNMSKVLDNMTRQQIGYALFKSGSKVGTPLVMDTNKDDKPVGRANKFYTEDSIVGNKKVFGTHGDINEENYNIQKVDYKYLGLQVKSSEPHDTVTFGTQVRKLAFAGAFEQGKERIPGAEALFREYTDIIRSQVDDAQAKLVEDLGLDPDNKFKAKDVTKLVELLRAESKSRSHADNIIEALQTAVDEAGNINLKYPLDAMVNKSKIDSMIMSLVNARLVRQKVNGDAYIQGASTGFETLGAREIGTNSSLSFYKEVKDEHGNVIATSKAEVMVPLSKQYYPLLDKYGSIEAINEAIANHKIDEKTLTLIGYRIPTQGLNSIDHLVIKQFLPTESAQLIILPTEIVAKSGGDYDIDKLNIFRPDLDKEGNYKESKHNRLIEIMSTMLSHPMNFAPLVTPNSTHILTDLVEASEYNSYLASGGELSMKEWVGQQSKKTDYTRQLMMTENVEQQHSKLMLAKDMIGIGAVNNVFIPLAQRVGAKLHTSYRDSMGNLKNIKINFPHHLVTEEDGRPSYIDLSRAKDALEINDIQEVNSQIINATVDAANSPGLLASLGMNMDTLSVYLYLDDIGVPFEFSFYMMKQPVMQKYIKESSINDSGFLAAIGAKESTTKLRERINGEYADKITKKLPHREYTTTEALKSYVDYEKSKNRTPESDNEFYNAQAQLFTDFLAYKEQAQLLSEAIRSVNHDTAGLGGNLESVHLKLESIAKVKRDNFVDGLDRINKDTPIGAFDKNQFAIDAYSQFYATQSPEIVKGMRSLLNFIAPFKSEDKGRLATMITNDFINYVTQNYGYDNIDQLYDRLFKEENSVAKRILRIQASPSLSNKEIASNLLIKELQPIIANDKTKDLIDNVRLYTKRFDTFTANQLTEAFRELKDLDMSLYQDIMDLGIIQSGLANSAITYVGIIPFEYFGDLFNKAFDEFDKKNGVSEFNKFSYLFLANNSKDPAIYKKVDDLHIQPIGNAQYGKNYSITPETQSLDTRIPTTISKEDIPKAMEEGPLDNYEDPGLEPNADFTDEDEFKNDPNVQFSKKTDEISQKLKASGYISQHNGELYIKQNFFTQASNLISSINKDTPGLLTKKMINHFGKGGRQIWKVEVNQQLGLQFGKGKQYNYISEQAFREIADKLKAKTGVEYEVVSPEEAIDILKEHGVDTNQFTTSTTPGFYLDGKIVMPSNYLTAENAFHEFAHPFVDVILKDNKALFLSLKRQMQSSIEGNAVINEVKQTYKDLVKDDALTDNGWKEAITTALGRMASKSITETKDKGLFSALKQMLKRIGETLSRLFSKDKVIKPIDLRVDTTLAELADMLNTDSKIEVDTKDKDIQFSKKEEEANPYARQQQYLQNALFKLEKDLRAYSSDSEEYNKALFDLAGTRSKFDQAILTGDENMYLAIGDDALNSAESIISNLKSNPNIAANDILQAKDIIDAWKEFQGLRDKSNKLEEELYPFINNLNIDKINEYSTRKEKVTQALIDSQTKDIDSIKKWVGALADSPNVIAQTIGTMISESHNKAAIKNKETNDKIQEELDALITYSKKNGVKVSDMYNVFIVEKEGSLSLIRGEFNTDGSVNPNWAKIQETPELLRYYNFYKDTINNLQQNIPYFKGSSSWFIPNLANSNIKDKLKKLSPLKERSTTYSKDENLKADIVPLEMHKPIPSAKKSKDLSEALSQYSKFSSKYEEMSKILPEVRLLQEEIKYVRDPKTGKITDRLYTKASNPSVKVEGKDSNLNKMVEDVINMQIKGKMKKDEGKYKYNDIYDENGEVTGEKYVDIAGAIDDILKYNSVLRIGGTMIGAVSNVVFGDISSIIEGVGGRFFTVRGLIQAGNIFWTQTWKKDSTLNKIHKDLDILRDLDDYNYSEDIKAKGSNTKLSVEKFEELLYAPQKKGELFIQSKVMLAIMIKDGLITSKGELTEKYNSLTAKEKDQLRGKIQQEINITQGRYTNREAATIQQAVIYRAFSQFRKWIPAAIENRFGSYNPHDNRLGTDNEGRYRTTVKLLGKAAKNKSIGDAMYYVFAPLLNAKAAIESGKMTELEVHNMRKMLAEVITWAILGFAYAGLHGNDDENKRRRKNPVIKTALTLLSRAEGDVNFFYSPSSLTNVAVVPIDKTIMDIIKTISLLPTVLEIGDQKDWAVQRGRKKGQSKFRAQLPKVLPAANAVNQLGDLFSHDNLANIYN